MLLKLKTLFYITNGRTISSKAKIVSSKITRVLKSAQVQKSVIQSRGKVAANVLIKEKAEQASKALKLPSYQVCWSVWLLQNSIKSIIKGYEIWLVNMNKYTLFRWFYFIVTYLLWPIQ